MNKTDVELENITTSTNDKLVTDESVDIKKKWTRNCPKCDRILKYSTIYNKLTADKCNTVCKRCNMTGKPNKNRIYFPDTIFSRYCPKCNRVIIHKTKQSWLKSKRDKSLCRKCAHNTTELKSKKRRAYKRRLEQLYGQLSPFYNTKACKLFDEINKEMNWNGQHAENIGEFYIDGYWLDYYEPTHNIVIEYDEYRHKYQLNHDLQKEIRVKELLNCQYFKIKEGDEHLWKTKIIN